MCISSIRIPISHVHSLRKYIHKTYASSFRIKYTHEWKLLLTNISSWAGTFTYITQQVLVWKWQCWKIYPRLQLKIDSLAVNVIINTPILPDISWRELSLCFEKSWRIYYILVCKKLQLSRNIIISCDIIKNTCETGNDHCNGPMVSYCA